MIIDASDKETESRLWQQYLAILPKMDEDHFTSYEKYKEEAFKPVQKKESLETILQRVEKIKNADKLRKEVNN